MRVYHHSFQATYSTFIPITTYNYKSTCYDALTIF